MARFYSRYTVFRRDSVHGSAGYVKFAVAARTGNVLAFLGKGTLDNLCGSVADRGNLFLLSFRLGFCLFVSDRCS